MSSASSDLQEQIAAVLQAEGSLRVAVPVLARVSKKLENEIQAAVNNQGLCISIMPINPTHVVEGAPFVFIDQAEVRVRIIEKVPINQTGADAWELRDDVMTALHWRPRDETDTPALALGAILAHPLELKNPPTQMMFESGQDRVIDVLFNAVFQLNQD